MKVYQNKQLDANTEWPIYALYNAFEMPPRNDSRPQHASELLLELLWVPNDRHSGIWYLEPSTRVTFEERTNAHFNFHLPKALVNTTPDDD